MSKQQFTMTQEEFEELKAIAQRPAIPVMKFGDCITGNEKQYDANSIWKRLGDKYGFVWDSAEGAGSDHKIFLATKK